MDKREAIMTRLVAIMEGIGLKTYRNQTDIPETRDPVVAILEGDEEVDDSGYAGGRPSNAPQLVEARPQVYILAGAESETVGPKLNSLRVQVLKAILLDSQLIALAHKGSIKYLGMQTGLATGRTMRAEASLTIAIPYVLRPNEF